MDFRMKKLAGIYLQMMTLKLRLETEKLSLVEIEDLAAENHALMKQLDQIMEEIDGVPDYLAGVSKN